MTVIKFQGSATFSENNIFLMLKWKFFHFSLWLLLLVLLGTTETTETPFVPVVQI